MSRFGELKTGAMRLSDSWLKDLFSSVSLKGKGKKINLSTASFLTFAETKRP